MAFYVERVIINNRAPFENIDLTFEENSLNVLTALNGKGKTTVLSYIVDAWVEITKRIYSNSYQGKENSYYRVSSPMELIDDKPSIVYIRFKYDNASCDYLNVRQCGERNWYDDVVKIKEKIPYNRLEDEMKNNEAFKLISNNVALSHSVFDNNLSTYFPAYRFELPNYLNDVFKNIEYKAKAEYNGYLKNPLEVTSSIREIVNWIFDVELDREVNSVWEVVQGKAKRKRVPEDGLWENLKIILENAIISKFPQRNVRFGIGRRNNSGYRLAVVEENGEFSKVYCPSVFDLSSGELAILAVFAEILRQADRTFDMSSLELKEISGIVLIDEVDKHLHIQLQKEVLPELFRLFPKVQFIVSSHSPFLNMGIADTEEMISRANIIDLDNNGFKSSPTNNEVYKEAYQLFLNEKNMYAEKCNDLKSYVSSLTKTVVITEGKTDIKLIKKAKEKLGYNIDFETVPEKCQPNGDSDLEEFIKQLSRIDSKRKVICIFDRDTAKTQGKKIVEKYDFDTTNWSENNVYAFCIPIPQFRKDNGQEKISIEYLFNDDEIHSKLPDGTQLFFGSDFEGPLRRCKFNDHLILRMPDKCGVDTIIESNKGQGVFEIEDQEERNLLATKNAFAEAIINDKISISKESWENFRPILDRIKKIIEG